MFNPKPNGCVCDTPDNYEQRDSECVTCHRMRQRTIHMRLTPAQRDYDNYVDPAQAYHDDFPPGCSCHINPPCAFCTSEGP